MAQRDYQFLTATMSFCEACEKLVPAKLAEREGKIYLLKYCPTHGIHGELYEEDAGWHRKKPLYDKPSTLTPPQTPLRNGCPYDCGLCPCHDQHTCIGLIEVTSACDLGCPVCYASSGAGKPLPLDTIEKMMRFYWEAEEGRAEILQLSGGEPTTHPEILKIIGMAREIGFPVVMLNTNGIRIAEDGAFADALARYSDKGFEVYLQYDGGDDSVYAALRGRPLADLKRRAIAALTSRHIPVTLVATVARGVNDNCLGEILDLAMHTDYVRGVNLQPLAYFGRLDGRERDPMTLSGVLNEIARQTGGLLQTDDFIPLPCNVERVAITYLLKRDGSFWPVTRGANPDAVTPMVENTFLFTAENLLKNAKTGCCCKCMDFLKTFRTALPPDFLKKSGPEKKEYIDTSTFRISVSSFVDMRSFDLKSMQKECVHIITEDLRRIPFSAYNMLYRNENG